MFGTKTCETIKRDNDYLKDELERERDYRRQQEDEAREKRERLKRERQQAYQENLQYADSWPDAFEKGIIRHGQEARLEADFIKEFPDHEPDGFWLKQIEIIEAARTIYSREESAMRTEIERLETELRNRVADELAKVYPDTCLAQNLRDNDYQALVCW